MDIKDKSIAEYSSSFLQRHYKKVFQRCFNDGIICITSADIKFYIINQETFDTFLKGSGLKIENERGEN